ncbi:MerR family transcriptional regulator [Aeromicrobium camelliae]|uniref:MerR family transcriptional regulator n=2 Tax=Aeromicrobium camelliae TaxID=1538144 RepID=A0A3N6X836_9ACTN|nr:MerR family transcriptional regulator [Aeromicrobium camelliae]
MLSPMREPTSDAEEFTVDELASRANMTVRNVRAYASRGLIDPPRLEGRTGYYNLSHLQRLQLIRQLLDRGFTLAAVEDAIVKSPTTAPGHALELMTLLGHTGDDDPSVLMSPDDLAALANVQHADPLIDALAELGLVERVDETTLRILDPQVVRPGAAAVALGLAPETVINAVPILREHLRAIADHLVKQVSDEIVQPFVDQGLPEHDWPRVFGAVEELLPIASQVILALFRSELQESIEIEVGDKLQQMGESGPEGTASAS